MCNCLCSHLFSLKKRAIKVLTNSAASCNTPEPRTVSMTDNVRVKSELIGVKCRVGSWHSKWMICRLFPLLSLPVMSSLTVTFLVEKNDPKLQLQAAVVTLLIVFSLQHNLGLTLPDFFLCLFTKIA